MMPILALLLCLCAGTMALPVVQVGFNDLTIAKVEANMLQISTHRYALSFTPAAVVTATDFRPSSNRIT